MANTLTQQEEEQLHTMLNDQRRVIPSLKIAANLLLLISGFSWVGTAFYLQRHYTDNAVTFVGLPNFIGGALLFIGYLLLSTKAKKLKQLNSLLVKFSEMTVAA